MVNNIPVLVWVAGVFVVIIVVAMFVQFISGIVNLCYCNKRADVKNHKNCSLTILIVFFLFYTVAFVLVVIYTSIVLNQISQPFCSFATLPYLMLNGVNQPPVTFLGLVPLENSLTNLATALGGLSSIQSNITNMNNLNLTQLGNNTLAARTTIQNGY